MIACDADPNIKWDVVKTLGHDVKAFTDSGEAVDYACGNQVDIALFGGPEAIGLIRHLREISYLIDATPVVRDG